MSILERILMVIVSVFFCFSGPIYLKYKEYGSIRSVYFGEMGRVKSGEDYIYSDELSCINLERKLCRRIIAEMWVIEPND